MALEAPLRSSTGNHHFPFAAQENMSGPAENERLRSPFRHLSSPPPATDSSLLRPSSVNRVSSHSTHMMSPSDIVGPSPVTSNGTETTEIEDDASDEIDVLSNTGSSSQRSEVSRGMVQNYALEADARSCSCSRPTCRTLCVRTTRKKLFRSFTRQRVL
jgi:hypothetical protein